MPYAEIMYVSAKTGQRLNKLYEMIDMVIENQTLRVATGVLNEIMTEAVAMQQPPSDKGKRLKLYYITQVSVKPPTFVIFVNDKELMHFSYTRYLEIRSERHLVSGNVAEILHPGEKRKGSVVMERIICLCIGYALRAFADRLSCGENQSYRHQKTGKRQLGLHQCATCHGLESRASAFAGEG